MAKGQQRSNREAKKPKKTAIKAKPGAISAGAGTGGSKAAPAKKR